MFLLLLHLSLRLSLLLRLWLLPVLSLLALLVVLAPVLCYRMRTRGDDDLNRDDHRDHEYDGGRRRRRLGNGAEELQLFMAPKQKVLIKLNQA